MNGLKYKLYSLWLSVQFSFLRRFPKLFKHINQEKFLSTTLQDFMIYCDDAYCWNYYTGNVYDMLEMLYEYNNTKIENWIRAINIIQEDLSIKGCNKCKRLLQEVVLNNVESFMHYFTDLYAIITYFSKWANKEQIDNLINLYIQSTIDWMSEDKEMYAILYYSCDEQQRNTLEFLKKLRG